MWVGSARPVVRRRRFAPARDGWRDRAVLLALPLAMAACSFDSQPVPARKAPQIGGSGSGVGQSGQGGTGGVPVGGSSGRGGAAGDRDATTSGLDAGPDSGPGNPRDGGPLPDARVTDADTSNTPCIPNATRSCYGGPAGTRGVGACKAGTYKCKPDGSGFGPCSGEVVPSADVCSNEVDDDCNGTVNDGFPDVDGCVCEPGAQQECYTGPAEFRGVGNCSVGAIGCNALGTGWSACTGAVLPTPPRCAVADRDCNGISDDQQDLDGDGFSLCDGDCCDRTADGCGTPARVNPGAYDIAANAADDDCSGTADDTVTACDNALVNTTAEAGDYAKALELCPHTTAIAPRSQQRWGVISAGLSLASGAGSPQALQRTLRTSFGAIAPQRGKRMVLLSTGHAAAGDDPAPAGGDPTPPFAPFEPGMNMGTTSAMPADWLAANGDNVQQLAACPSNTIAAIDVHDSVMLTLTLRVPTNMSGFTLRGYMLSSEFPEYVCDVRSDYVLALLGTVGGAKLASNPSDGNLATFSSGGKRYPLGPTLAFDDSGLFRQCQNGTLSCEVNGGASLSQITTCQGIADLAGTGFEQAAQASNPPCDANAMIGGGTGWFTLSGNVTPGTTIVLRLMIWDTGDYEQDSVVLFDDFSWTAAAVTSGISL